MQERVYIELPDARHEYYPDVRVIEHPRRPETGGDTTAVASPPPPSRPLTGTLPRPSRS
jgi:hypothetical protein